MSLILASTSPIRLHLLRAAGVPVTAQAARIDEQAIRDALLAEGAGPRDIADTLAEMKARKVAERNAQDWVLGCDQILDCDGQMLSKAETAEQALAHLQFLRGRSHRLLSAAVLYERGQPVWRHVATARLTMRQVSDAYLSDYVARNWPGIGQSVGAYKLEEEGVRLFSAIEGDSFTVLGLPLLPILGYLGERGIIAS